MCGLAWWNKSDSGSDTHEEASNLKKETGGLQVELKDEAMSLHDGVRFATAGGTKSELESTTEYFPMEKDKDVMAIDQSEDDKFISKDEVQVERKTILRDRQNNESSVVFTDEEKERNRELRW